MKIAFYISGKAGRLVKFVKQADGVTLKQIEVVISDADIPSETKEVLNAAGLSIVEIPYSLLSGGTNKARNLELSNRIDAVLSERKVDYCISFGSHILSGALLEHYKWRLINFHPALLPQFPGVKAIDQAVAHGNVFLVGNTVHFIDSGIDTGRIIMQSVVPLKAFSDAHDNYDIVLDLQIDMLNKLIKILEENRLHVYGERVEIEGADYTMACCFPKICL